jgi:rsbT co-antagonist protein RsbR
MDAEQDTGAWVAELCALLRDQMPSQSEAGPREITEAVKLTLAQIEQARQISAQASKRLDSLLGVIVGLVSFDYSKRARVTGADDALDGLALGLNMLAQELANTSVSKNYVNNIIESMPDLLVVIDTAGTIKSANRAAGRLCGYSPNDLLSKSIALLFPAISVPALVDGGGMTDVECDCVTSEGSSVKISFSASLMRNRHGGIEGIVCVGRDLTESKRLAEERWKLRDSIQRQAILLEELSTPLIPITQKILVLPLIGSLDEARASQMMEALLYGLTSSAAEVVIVDITGLRGADTQAVAGIVRAVRAAGLIGAKGVLTGIRQDFAGVLVRLGSDLSGIPTFSTLERGVSFALRHYGASLRQ